MTMTPLQRFMSYVDVIEETGCVCWTATCDKAGYGKLTFDGKPGQLAHRVAWTLLVGPIPAGADVLHRCDNPPCVNPDHLFLGDDFINQQDRVSKGRHHGHHPQNGEDNLSAVLTEAQVIEIRAMCAGRTMTQRAIAHLFGVTPSNVAMIKTRRTWKHLPH